MAVTTRPIWELLYTCDVAYTSNATSAAADAYGAGLPVVTMLDLSALNQSPLRGLKGVLFVITVEDLVQAILSIVGSPHSSTEVQNFFTLDPEIPRWRNLLLESTNRNTV